MMKYRSTFDNSPNLGMLSISSLAGTNTNIDDPDDDFDHTAELYQRLHDLEQMTQTFLNERPIRLSEQHDSFTDVDKGSKQDFELQISEFLHDVVLCLSVYCIPETVNDESIYVLDEAPKVVREHQPLDICLYRLSSVTPESATKTQNSTDPSFAPSLHNGEYSYALTSAAGIIPGIYRLTIHNVGFATQPIRVTQKILPCVRAIPVRAGQKLIGCNGASEFSFFRFVSTSPSELVTIRAKPIFDEGGTAIGDPDLYVTNRFNGLVAVNKENFVWKSTNVGADRVDIHPSDLDVARGCTYVIGVLGYKDRNEWELEVTTSAPRPLRPLEVGESIEVQLNPEDTKYFTVHVDSTNKCRMFLTVTPLPDSLFSSDGSDSDRRRANDASDTAVDEDAVTAMVSQAYGRSVYTCDSLAAFGVVGKGSWMDGQGPSSVIPPLPSIIKAQSATVDGSALFAAALPQALPPSICLDRGLFPVAHFSSGCMYPSAEDYTWRSSGADGNVLAMFDNDEWKYTHGTCYVSLSAVRLAPAAAAATEKEKEKGTTISPDKQRTTATTATSGGGGTLFLNCRITLWESSTLDRLPSDLRDKHEVFHRVFRDIDGSNVSQKERNRVGREDQSLTYGEVEFLPFLDILKAAGASHGDAFYDLGCGAGKALVAAALSGIQFLTCVGLELLPGLCDLARDALANVKIIVKAGGTSSRSLPTMEVRMADILTADWSAADVVYISSICFSDSFVQSIFEKSKELKPGSKFITLKLPGSLDGWFEVESQAWYKMTWGRIMVYFLRRTAYQGE